MIERTLTIAIAGAITIALATTVLGRSNTAKVINAGGSAFSNVISAALGKGVDIR
jgi:hypothetical protein